MGVLVYFIVTAAAGFFLCENDHIKLFGGMLPAPDMAPNHPCFAYFTSNPQPIWLHIVCSRSSFGLSVQRLCPQMARVKTSPGSCRPDKLTGANWEGEKKGYPEPNDSSFWSFSLPLCVRPNTTMPRCQSRISIISYQTYQDG